MFRGKHWKILSFVGIAFLLFGLIGSVASAVPSDAHGISEVVKIKYTAHAPIHITSDDDFSSVSTGGTGTQDDPYVIEGLEIDANGGSYGIWIENTTAYFVLENCKVWNATSSTYFPYGSGITLKNVQHGEITDNNDSNNNYAGIYLWYSSNNTVVNNTVMDNSNYGISMDHSGNNIISGNNATNNTWDGIILNFSEYNNITGNNMSSNIAGLYMYESGNNSLKDNDMFSNSYYGILMWGSNNSKLTGNNVSGNSNYGLYLHAWASHNNISYNSFYSNAKYGIYIDNHSSDNTIIHNNFIGNNGATKGTTGSSQAYDDVGGNTWYSEATQKGNYWSNWDGQGWGTSSAYQIAGGAGAYDKYPLGSPAVPELSYFAVILFVSLFLAYRRKAR